MSMHGLNMNFEIEDSVCFGCDAASLGNWCQHSEGPSVLIIKGLENSYWNSRPLKMKVLLSFKYQELTTQQS